MDVGHMCFFARRDIRSGEVLLLLLHWLAR
jgi:hypothetical protein